MKCKVKVCGVTNIEDAMCALKDGAHMIGFIFYKKSPRYISPSQVKMIVNELSPLVVSVGVFVNESIDTIEKIVAQCGLKAVQLHGDETPSFCKKIKKKVMVIKAVRIASEKDLEQISTYREAADMILLDTYSENQYGGTGKTFNWNLAKKALKLHPYIILSGGLTPANVGDAVLKVKPYAIDVSSGVEKEPGVKDHAKIKKFMKNV